MSFRKDINGLRAVAVLAVVLFHFQVIGFSGGFSGVDVFFVISGYLMTKAVFSKLRTQTFSIINFYSHRARRIIPALATLCLFLLVFGYYCLLYSDYISVIKFVKSSITFTSNIVYYHETDYFATQSKYNWLLHTWSLSLEWQFYLFYPIFLVALNKVSNEKIIKAILVFVVIFSFTYSYFYTTLNPTGAFYLLLSRIWEMIAGGLVFLFPIYLNKRLQLGGYVLGIIFIILSIVALDDTAHWPGHLAALPVLGAVLVLLVGCNDVIITNNSISQFIGKISYSVYLWHWPIVVFCVLQIF